ncbi:MAG: 6-hydroxymethylpterin diphosphokinase MptE-like protein [Chloroflexota bacterium]
MKASFKRFLPASLWSLLGRSYDAILRLPELPQAELHPWRRYSKHNLAQLHNSQIGKRCFIIGNGPSLRHLDLFKLKNEITFGMNRIYLLFPEMGFSTTYFVSINDLVIQQCAGDIRALTMPRFLAWRSHPHIQPTLDMSFLYTTYTGPKFSRNVGGRVWEGATVTYVALQLAFHMGFEEVILIGVDHNFISAGDPNQTVTSSGDDPNHFSPAYFGKGFKWQLPDLETSEIAYRMAKAAFEGAGRRILDATLGGKLTVFPKVDYDSLF